MPKNIVVCSDGTGNQDIKGRGTNVFKLFEAVDLNEHRTDPALDTQLAFYDDGVGTKGNALLKTLGGAAGYGLKRNVKELYREISRVYDPGDRIFLFGFSRGAFTVRTLAGMIGKCGLLKGGDFHTARGLRHAVEHAYDAYRAQYHSTLSDAVGRVLRWPDGPTALATFNAKYHPHQNVPIAFLGVWDTVDAVGMPFSIAEFVNSRIYQFKFSTRDLGRHVVKACHALSIDDTRLAFEPILWQGDPRIEQVWFAGVHSNVGGGYPKQGMSLVALDWMLAHAERAGLRLQHLDRELFRGHATVDDLMYNPRSGMGVFYQWGPRDVLAYCRRSGSHPAIHLSVAERIAHATDDYAPGNIPSGASVVITPVEMADPKREEKERLLEMRAGAIEKSLADALGERYLLHEVQNYVRIGTASYVALLLAGLLLGVSLSLLTGGLVFSQPWLRAGELAAIGGLTALLVAAAASRVANSGLEDHFSLFWQQNQNSLRDALKYSKIVARQQSGISPTPSFVDREAGPADGAATV
ncbi:MAG TPA: DUF2235 domain-containing protein [Vicinamibacterales bacterium]|nr:DUF2235 domain-containing protein [Vicinamibacterales bacterium]